MATGPPPGALSPVKPVTEKTTHKQQALDLCDEKVAEFPFDQEMAEFYMSGARHGGPCVHISHYADPYTEVDKMDKMEAERRKRIKALARRINMLIDERRMEQVDMYALDTYLRKLSADDLEKMFTTDLKGFYGLKDGLSEASCLLKNGNITIVEAEESIGIPEAPTSEKVQRELEAALCRVCNTELHFIEKMKDKEARSGEDLFRHIYTLIHDSHPPEKEETYEEEGGVPNSVELNSLVQEQRTNLLIDFVEDTPFDNLYMKLRFERGLSGPEYINELKCMEHEVNDLLLKRRGVEIMGDPLDIAFSTFCSILRCEIATQARDAETASHCNLRTPFKWDTRTKSETHNDERVARVRHAAINEEEGEEEGEGEGEAPVFTPMAHSRYPPHMLQAKEWSREAPAL